MSSFGQRPEGHKGPAVAQPFTLPYNSNHTYHDAERNPPGTDNTLRITGVNAGEAAMDVVEEIKSRLDIVDVIGSYISLQRSGKNYKALCPFHEEKTPSFIVFPETQTWHCFGACNTGGDIFSFVMKREGVDFKEALRMLAQRAGIPLDELHPEAGERGELRERLRAMHAAATAYYQDNLLRRAEGEPAREYVKQRGLNPETIAAFQLGYALDAWDGLMKYLTELGFSEEEMEQGGLIIRRENGTAYDRFRNRLIIPIHDTQGRVIAFAGRVIGAGEPKYLNSPQTPLFDKGRTLYGYAQAVRAIRAEDRVIIVEGYMDVLSAHQAGFRNVVASMGTALTPTQLRMLSRHTKHIILALDADVAGQKAALRGVEVARDALDRRVEPMITPTGAIRFQTTLDVDIRLLTLPEGLDPDDLIRREPERWTALVNEALPVVDFYLKHIQHTLNLNTPQGKREAVQVMSPLLREISDATVQDHYLQRLARLLQVDERALAADIFKPQPRRSLRQKQVPPSPQRTPAPLTTIDTAQQSRALETHIIILLLRTPTVLGEIGDALRRLGQEDLTMEEFEDVRHRLILQVLLTRLVSGNLKAGGDVLVDIPEDMHEYVQTLLEHAHNMPDVPLHIARQETVAAILHFRLKRHRELAHQLRFLLEEAQTQNDEHLLLTYGVKLGNHLRAIHQLERLLPAAMSVH